MLELGGLSAPPQDGGSEMRAQKKGEESCRWKANERRGLDSKEKSDIWILRKSTLKKSFET